jgi:hypothetical protein
MPTFGAVDQFGRPIQITLIEPHGVPLEEEQHLTEIVSWYDMSLCDMSRRING